MFNTGTLSTIPFVLFLDYGFLLDPAQLYYGKKQVPVIWTKRRASLITFSSTITFEDALLSQETVNDRTPSDIYYSEPISGGLCSGLIETLNAHRERLSERTACTNR